MIIHISTNESYLTGALEIKDYECPLCGLEGICRSGYINSHCSRCDQYYDHDCWHGSVVMQLRKAMGYKRREFAEKMLGVKYQTLKKAEFVRCSEPIYAKTKAIFQQYVLENQLKELK